MLGPCICARCDLFVVEVENHFDHISLCVVMLTMTMSKLCFFYIRPKNNICGSGNLENDSDRTCLFGFQIFYSKAGSVKNKKK